MTPPPAPHRPRQSKDSGSTGLSTIVTSIIAAGVVLALAIAIGVPALFRYMKRREIDRRNQLSYEERSKMIINNLKAGVEFTVHDSNQTSGDSYTFRLQENDFVPVTDNAAWVRPFLYRIDRIVPDSKGRVSIDTGDDRRVSLAIDSLIIHNSEAPYSPITLRVADSPSMTAVLTYIDADVYNHCEKDSFNYHSYVGFVKGYLFESDPAGVSNKTMPGGTIDSDDDRAYYSYTLHADDFAPVAKGATGLKQFVCQVDNKVPDASGKVFVGTANARGWLNIDSLVHKASHRTFEPIPVKVNKSSNTLLLTELSVTTKNHKDKTKNEYKSYTATIHGYVFSKDPIISQ